MAPFPRVPRWIWLISTCAFLLTLGGGATVLHAQEPGAINRVRWWHGLVAVGGFALLTAVDEPAQRFSVNHRSDGSNQAARFFKHMGQPEVFATAGLGMVALGALAGNQKIKAAGLRVSGALALSGVLVTVTKLAAGRSRPSHAGSDPDDFAPFSGAASAPSGHTTMAFALAASLGDEIRNPWVTAGLYVAATGTAWSRVNDNAHWVSDVVAGAGLGILTAKFVEGRISLFGVSAPSVVPCAGGVAISYEGHF
ncbi:MAG: phosphatase PAP2 family protein [Gemmatimonadota bacterium]